MWKCWKERRDKTEIYFKKDNNHLQRRKNRPGFILQRVISQEEMIKKKQGRLGI